MHFGVVSNGDLAVVALDALSIKHRGTLPGVHVSAVAQARNSAKAGDEVSSAPDRRAVSRGTVDHGDDAHMAKRRQECGRLQRAEFGGRADAIGS